MRRGSGFRWWGDDVAVEVADASRQGVFLALEFILERSRAEVPIEEATLERSGATDVHPSEPRGTIFYDTAYAVVQHERLEFRHDPGRKAKYLEDPLYSYTGEVEQILARSIGGAM